MARPSAPSRKVSGNPPLDILTAAAGATPTAAGAKKPAAMASSAAVFRQGKKVNPKTDRKSIAQPWQVEVYRQVNICGEARYAATLFSNIAGRAEIGVSEPQALARKAVWVEEGAEVDAFAELAPTVRDRTKLVRDFMLHWIIAGECYLIARKRVDTDPGYIAPPDPFEGTWEEYIATFPLNTGRRPPVDPNVPIWEIVAVTELRHVGDKWEVRHDNGNFLELDKADPVIRLWNPDPENRREAWSPFRALLPTLREIEWFTQHIFTQVRSRLMAAGVWFLPDNLTFPDPPPDAVEGGAEAIAAMNDAERFMVSLAASSMQMLDPDEVSFPTVVMADAIALANVDKDKLIQFWSELDDKAMTMRSDAVRRFALGMDLPPEQVLGSSGLAVTGTSGSAGSVNHWGVWANEEQTISAHIEPALDVFVSILTTAFLRSVADDTEKVIAYDTATLRLRQDRSKEALLWYQEGVLKAEVAIREAGFDPDNDMMENEERKMWILTQLVKGSLPPEQTSAILMLLTGVQLPAAEPVSGNEAAPRGIAGPALPRNSDDYPVEGPPRVQHDHSPAPYSAFHASCEALVLRALEKAGNRLLNDGKRGRDKDRTTPPHMAHMAASAADAVDPQIFDFTLANTVFPDLPATELVQTTARLRTFCTDLYQNREPYRREALVEAVDAR